MGTLGVLTTKSDTHKIVTNYLEKKSISFHLFDENQDFTSLDGIIISIKTKDQLAGEIKKIFSFQKESGSFVWVFSEEQLTSERELLLELGINEVLTTPEALPYLVKIVENTLNRLDKRKNIYKNETNSVYSIYGNKFRQEDGQRPQLTKRENSIFSYLKERKNQIVTYEELSEHIWNSKNVYYRSYVANIIHGLREKLSEHKQVEIKNVRLLGYLLEIKDS